jgi:hypothetical protein
MAASVLHSSFMHACKTDTGQSKESSSYLKTLCQTWWPLCPLEVIHHNKWNNILIHEGLELRHDNEITLAPRHSPQTLGAHYAIRQVVRILIIFFMTIGYEKKSLVFVLIDTAACYQHMAPLIIGHGTDNVYMWT